MTLERISIMGKVLAQLSPAMSPENIDAAVRRMRQLLADGELQQWAARASNMASNSHCYMKYQLNSR